MQRTPVRKIVVTSAVLVLGLAVLAGCGGSDSGDSGGSGSGKAPATAKVYGPGDDIVVDEGQTFVIAVESNPTTGYEWSAATNANAEFVTSEVSGSSSTLAGAPGTQRLTFRATDPGSSTLTLSYARSFEPGVPPVRTEAFPLTVR